MRDVTRPVQWYQAWRAIVCRCRDFAPGVTARIAPTLAGSGGDCRCSHRTGRLPVEPSGLRCVTPAPGGASSAVRALIAVPSRHGGAGRSAEVSRPHGFGCSVPAVAPYIPRLRRARRNPRMVRCPHRPHPCPRLHPLIPFTSDIPNSLRSPPGHRPGCHARISLGTAGCWEVGPTRRGGAARIGPICRFRCSRSAFGAGTVCRTMSSPSSATS